MYQSVSSHEETTGTDLTNTEKNPALLENMALQGLYATSVPETA